jgi:transposase
MKLYAGIDLHSSSSYLAIIDDKGVRSYKKKLPNNLEEILQQLMPYKKRITGVVVESTYNWYWLVEGLEAEGYAVNLANPSAIQR